jgi:hypothetical protein
MFLAGLVFVACWIALTDIMIRVGRLPLAGALPLAFAGWIALESVLLNMLSLFHAVNRPAFLWAHMFVICCWGIGLGLAWRTVLLEYARQVRGLFRRFCRHPPFVLLLPLILLLGLAAWCYPPNTYDSMVYHMSRVAHWIQYGSVAYYPTAIDRQNFMGPGAEYLILFFQIIARSDRYASFIQFWSLICVLVSMVFLLRFLRVPRRWSPWICILAASAPMALMQGSSTKNDMVAALMSIAMLLSGRRLLVGDIRNMEIREYVLLGIAIGAGLLVKPTSLLAAAPPLALGFILQAHRCWGNLSVCKRLVGGTLLAIMMIVLVNGPDITRKTRHHLERPEVYPLFSHYDTDRLWNPVRGVAQNIPFTRELPQWLEKAGYHGPLLMKNVMNLQEDMIGNPYQMLTAIILALITMITGILLIGRKQLLAPWFVACSPVLSWFFFGIMVRDQAWLTRLQLPLFFLLPLSFAYLGRILDDRHALGRLMTGILSLLAVVSLSYGFIIASHVPARPLIPDHFWGKRSDTDGYYQTMTSLKKEHDILLTKAKEIGCERIGLVLGGDSVDYPLTWRAMLEGRQTRHLRNHMEFTDDQRHLVRAWPCLVYAAAGVPEHVPQRGIQWLDSGDGYTYERNLHHDFKQSNTVLFSLAALIPGWRPMHINSLEAVPKESGALLLRANGADPFLLLPAIDAHGVDSAVVQLQLKSPEPTSISIYFRQDSKSNYSEKKKIRRRLNAGDNTLYLFVPAEYLTGQLRLDPGEIPGDYLLQSFEIRAIGAGKVRQ